MDLAPPAPPEPARAGVPSGPVPLTLRQAGVAAALILAVALATSLLLPVVAALQARFVVPPGAVVVGRASFLPADGWAVVETRQDAVVLARAGTSMLVRYDASASPVSDPAGTALGSLQDLAARTVQEAPDVRVVGGVRSFSTTTQDPGYLQALASPGTNGVLAVVGGEDAQVVVEAAGPSTSFAPLFGQVGEMVTGLRLQEGAS